jgi:hypothetical protein
MVAVRTFLNRIEAGLASGVLAGENIDSIIQADEILREVTAAE